MGDQNQTTSQNSIINFGDYSKPVNTLIEKVSDALGGAFKPFQIRRVAEAEADAERIRAVSKIEISDLERRAMHRFIREEALRQANIESITQKALPGVEKTATPENMSNDWIANFFQESRLVSD